MTTQYRVYIFTEEGTPAEFITRKLSHVLDLCNVALRFSALSTKEQEQVLQDMARELRKYPTHLYVIGRLIIVKKEKTDE